METTVEITVEGMVQGVGFRPFVYRLATQMGLTGWVNNSSTGATVMISGNAEAIAVFQQRLQGELPIPGKIEQLTVKDCAWQRFADFQIRPSRSGEKTTAILPDLAPCPACLAELLDPKNRRYGYPFINCTHCGPRYSIIRGLPYDRPYTTMAQFVMCPDCQREYDDPGDRRFHAQPNACPRCGPRLTFWDQRGNTLGERDEALQRAINGLNAGKILAIKGVGGFHLCCDATNFEAVQILRERKHRPDKPLAVMYPHRDLICQDCEVSVNELKLLQSSAAPIVLLRKKKTLTLADNIAPANGEIGVVLPPSPLHYLLLTALGKPMVATSGNVSGDPICIDNQDALNRLNSLVDGFLVHDRPIVGAVDDSVVRIVQEKPLFLRRSRGYAPLPIPLPQSTPTPLLAVGGYFKNTVAIAKGNQAYLSQHIGDLASPQSYQAFQKIIQQLSQLYDFQPVEIIGDCHPDYLSHQYALQQSLPVEFVQHHYAHVLAVMVEQQVTSPVLGIAWDGTGYGLDGTIWGGEFLRLTDHSWQRVAHFRPFPLLGNQQAIRDPRRIALALLWETFGEQLPDNFIKQFKALNLPLLKQLWQRQTSPLTSSVGRLFDGVSALLALVTTVSFEGQGAIALESQIGDPKIDQKNNTTYPYVLERVNHKTVIDWRPMIKAIALEIHTKSNTIASIASQ
ncbi:MAG: carbamoyltransferase HypF, partial [Synechocystis sp.]|nr:carbamoyltransferase HypF [Synechocystis sp.]